MDTAIADTAGFAEVVKFDLPTMLSATPQTGVDGEFLWPIPPRALSTLYQSSAEHGRAINLKAESAFGGGLIGERATTFEDLCERGSADLFVTLGVDLETYGNAFLQVIRSRDRIAALRRLPAITMSRTRTGFLQRDPQPGGDVKKIPFAQDEVLHLRVPCPTGGRYALPSWIGVEGMLGLAKAAIDYNAKFFGNNAMPEYAVIFTGATPSKEQKETVASFFRNEFKGLENTHRTLVLHLGEGTTVEIKRLTAEVKDADFLKLIDAARDRIPVAHGVPPRMLGIVSAGQLGGGGEVSGQLFTFELLTLRPKRRQMLDQLRPILKLLDLAPGDPDDGLAANQVAFRPLDLTPPGEDIGKLPDLVAAGILSPDEAKLFLPGFEAGRSSTANTPLARSAETSALDLLTAMLART